LVLNKINKKIKNSHPLSAIPFSNKLKGKHVNYQTNIDVVFVWNYILVGQSLQVCKHFADRHYFIIMLCLGWIFRQLLQVYGVEPAPN
jgi:hypothetical protein